MEQFTITALKEAVYDRIESIFKSGAEAENQGKGLANSPSDDPLPLQHGQGASGSMRSKWLLGGPPLGIEPRPIRH